MVWADGAGASSIMAAFKIRETLKGKSVVLQMSGCNASPEEIKKACERRAFQKGEPIDSSTGSGTGW
jgi:threonine dehydratase